MGYELCIHLHQSGPRGQGYRPRLSFFGVMRIRNWHHDLGRNGEARTHTKGSLTATTATMSKSLVRGCAM